MALTYSARRRGGKGLEIGLPSASKQIFTPTEEVFISRRRSQWEVLGTRARQYSFLSLVGAVLSAVLTRTCFRFEGSWFNKRAYPPP